MHSYHVYFTPKEGFSPEKVAQLIHHFGEREKTENLMHNYQLVMFDNKASFEELFDYHFVAHYRSEEERTQAFKSLSHDYMKEPHLSLMKMTKEFKVAFSVDL